MDFLHRIKTYQLMLVGLALIAIALWIEHRVIDSHLFTKLLGEVGVLLLVVGTLHFLFEHGLRQAMLKDILNTVLAGGRIVNNGITDFHKNSREINNIDDNITHWKEAKNLIIGVHYDDSFIKFQIEVFQQRCQQGKQTEVILLKPDSLGAEYLRKINLAPGETLPEIAPHVEIITRFLTHFDTDCQNTQYVRFFLHNYVLRYCFIATEDYIWVNLFFNSKGTSPIPAFVVKANSPLYQLYWEDIQRLREQSEVFNPEKN